MQSRKAEDVSTSHRQNHYCPVSQCVEGFRGSPPGTTMLALCEAETEGGI